MMICMNINMIRKKTKELIEEKKEELAYLLLKLVENDDQKIMEIILNEKKYNDDEKNKILNKIENIKNAKIKNLVINNHVLILKENDNDNNDNNIIIINNKKYTIFGYIPIYDLQVIIQKFGDEFKKITLYYEIAVLNSLLNSKLQIELSKNKMGIIFLNNKNVLVKTFNSISSSDEMLLKMEKKYIGLEIIKKDNSYMFNNIIFYEIENETNSFIELYSFDSSFIRPKKKYEKNIDEFIEDGKNILDTAYNMTINTSKNNTNTDTDTAISFFVNIQQINNERLNEYQKLQIIKKLINNNISIEIVKQKIDENIHSIIQKKNFEILLSIITELYELIPDINTYIPHIIDNITEEYIFSENMITIKNLLDMMNLIVIKYTIEENNKKMLESIIIKILIKKILFEIKNNINLNIITYINQNINQKYISDSLISSIIFNVIYTSFILKSAHDFNIDYNILFISAINELLLIKSIDKKELVKLIELTKDITFYKYIINNIVQFIKMIKNTEKLTYAEKDMIINNSIENGLLMIFREKWFDTYIMPLFSVIFSMNKKEYTIKFINLYHTLMKEMCEEINDNKIYISLIKESSNLFSFINSSKQENMINNILYLNVKSIILDILNIFYEKNKKLDIGYYEQEFWIKLLYTFQFITEIQKYQYLSYISLKNFVSFLNYYQPTDLLTSFEEIIKNKYIKKEKVLYEFEQIFSSESYTVEKINSIYNIIIILQTYPVYFDLSNSEKENIIFKYHRYIENMYNNLSNNDFLRLFLNLKEKIVYGDFKLLSMLFSSTLSQISTVKLLEINQYYIKTQNFQELITIILKILNEYDTITNNIFKPFAIQKTDLKQLINSDTILNTSINYINTLTLHMLKQFCNYYDIQLLFKIIMTVLLFQFNTENKMTIINEISKNVYLSNAPIEYVIYLLQYFKTVAFNLNSFDNKSIQTIQSYIENAIELRDIINTYAKATIDRGIYRIKSLQNVQLNNIKKLLQKAPHFSILKRFAMTYYMIKETREDFQEAYNIGKSIIENNELLSDRTLILTNLKTCAEKLGINTEFLNKINTE